MYNKLNSLCDLLTLQTLINTVPVSTGQRHSRVLIRMVKCSFWGKRVIHLGATFVMLISLFSALAWLITTEQRFNDQVTKVSLIIQVNF